ncbi:MAG: hypothetical protein NTU64_16075, partial [Hyphomicrobiales bacterium]|nr:hypothetical protein [Hyphomicrobiales bacterium]
KGSNATQSKIDACSTERKPPKLKSDEPVYPVNHTAICLKLSDDGHCPGIFKDFHSTTFAGHAGRKSVVSFEPFPYGGLLSIKSNSQSPPSCTSLASRASKKPKFAVCTGLDPSLAR